MLGRAGRWAALPLFMEEGAVKKDYLKMEDLPRLREQDSPREQAAMLQDNMAQMAERLRYVLGNLTEENFNEAALARLEARFAAAEDIALLRQEVERLRALVTGESEEDNT